MTPREKFLARVIYAIPTPMLVNPERVAIKLAVSVSGFAALLFVEPLSLAALLPRWATLIWGATWAVGGVAGLFGYWLPRRYLERVGHLLIIVGALEYAISNAVVIGLPSYVSIALVLVVAYCSAIRLLVAAGARQSRRNGRI